MPLIHRAVRTPGPPMPRGDVPLVAPPRHEALQMGAAGWLQYLFPAVGGLGALLFVVVNPRPIYVLGGLLFALGSVAMGVGMGLQQRSMQRRRVAGERTRYLMHLSMMRRRVRAIREVQSLASAWLHPHPAAFQGLIRERARLWERRPEDDDFLSLRVGVGPALLAARLAVTGVDDHPGSSDPVCTHAVHRFVELNRSIPDQPVTIGLRKARIVSVVGPRSEALNVARALVAQATVLHAPDELTLALSVGADTKTDWEWCKWLPHIRPARNDGGSASSPVGIGPQALEQVLVARAEDSRRRSGAANAASVPGSWLLAIADGPSPTGRAVELLWRRGGCGASLVVLCPDTSHEPGHVGVRIRVSNDGVVAVDQLDGQEPPIVGRVDRLERNAAEGLAKRLSPLRISADSGQRRLERTVPLGSLLEIADLTGSNRVESWQPRPLQERLRVPMGVTPEGEPVVLDLKEAALGGDGPHGLVVGATGAGKSELLRTMVTGLALTHAPDLLAFVLVDFKGGAAFAGLNDLPHVAGLITNLADDLAMVDRMHTALFGETRRRQELLRSAGNLPSLREYQQRVAAGGSLPPLPYLLIIVDEFSELLTAKPEFADLFVAMGRLGRSLGIHLLLSSQQLDEGKIRGLEGHLSYRIGLRTFSAQESRTVLGSSDAYELPPIPGSGYFKVGTSVYTRFRAAMVSQPYAQPQSGDAEVERPTPFNLVQRSSDSESTDPGLASASAMLDADASSPTVLDMVVGKLRNAAPRVHQVWLPPLEPTVTLDALVGPLSADPERGLVATSIETLGQLAAPVGLVDRPGDQARGVLMADLAGASGHLLLVGAPQTGKSVFLRTLVLSLALTHTPREAHVYCCDYGGGGLMSVADLPHVGGVCGRNDTERLRRTITQVAGLLDERERWFKEAGIDSPQAIRARRTGGEDFADVFLVLDNWPAIRQEFEDLEPSVQDLAARGLGYGIHLVLTAHRWQDVRAALREAVGGRLELRLNDPMESAIDRRAAANVAQEVPGRGLTTDSLHFQTALPRVDGEGSAADLQTAVLELVGKIRAAWSGPEAPRVRMLPSLVRADELDVLPDGGDCMPFAISEVNLQPVHLDLSTADPHFLVFGDSESGKTTVLRTLIHGLLSRFSPDQAQVLVVDYRRTLLDVVPADYLLGYSGAAPAAQAQVEETVQVLARRLPGPEVTVDQLRTRSWWRGPHAYVVVDDYELVATQSGNPLLPLVQLLPQARDVGLHVLLARGVGGASRGVLETMLLSLRELGSPGLLLNGSPREGPLLGTHRATPQPPGRGLLVRRHERPALVQVVVSAPQRSVG